MRTHSCQKPRGIPSPYFQVFLFTVLLSHILQTGCYLTPNLGPPGTIGMQRSRAVLNDPFPNNDIAPPIVGGRPLGFDRPLAEPVQNQVNTRNGGAAVMPYQGF